MCLPQWGKNCSHKHREVVSFPMYTRSLPLSQRVAGLSQGESAVSCLLGPETTGCRAQFIALSDVFSFGSNPLQYICNISNALAEIGLFWRPDTFMALASHPFLFNLVLNANKCMHRDLHTGRLANVFRFAYWGLHLYCNHCCNSGCC